MFLSTRWGVPSYEIENLPLSEYNKQKIYWEHHMWGVTDDLLAMQHNFYARAKGVKDPLSSVELKRVATYTGAVKAFVIESTKSLRASIMAVAELMTKKPKK